MLKSHLSGEWGPPFLYEKAKCPFTSVETRGSEKLSRGTEEAEVVQRDRMKRVNRSSSHFADRSGPEPRVVWPQASRPHLPEPQLADSL